MKPNKILSLLGLATRSRNVVSGEFMTEKAVKSHEAMLVIVSEEASDNTKKKFRNMCEFHHVPFYIWGASEQLGHAMGKEFRMSVAVLDEGFAGTIIKLLTDTVQ